MHRGTQFKEYQKGTKKKERLPSSQAPGHQLLSQGATTITAKEAERKVS